MYHNYARFERFQDIDFQRCTIIIQDLEDSKILIFPRCTRIIQDSIMERYWFSKMHHNYARFPRFQDIDFPWCSILIQDFKDCKILIFQDVQQLFKISKIPRYWFSKVYHNYSRISKIPKNDFRDVLRFPNHLTLSKHISKTYCTYHRFTRIYNDSKIIQNYKRFTESPRCWSFFKNVKAQVCLTPTI